MQGINGIKVFKMNDCDWWAGATLEECVADYPDEDTIEEPAELTDEEMNEFIYAEDHYCDTQKSFRQKLEEMVKAGEQFPRAFASTEY